MPVSAQRVSVGTAATSLMPAPDVDSVMGQTLAVKNLGAASVFIGGAGVTTAQGWEIPAGDPPVTLELPTGAVLYGIVTADTVLVQVMQVGV